MTEDEEGTYNYIRGKYSEEAEKYYRTIEDELNQRKGAAQYEPPETSRLGPKRHMKQSCLWRPVLSRQSAVLARLEIF